MAAMFDTHKFINKLKAAGVPEKQAEAEAEALAEAMSTSSVTKLDLAETRQALETNMLKIKQELKDDIAELRGDMKVMRWMITFILAMIVAIFWLLIRADLRMPS